MSTRTRNFCGVCYFEQMPDLRRYMEEYTNRGIIRAFYVIQHEPEQEDKQIHYHYIIEYYEAKTLSAVEKKTGLRHGLIEICTDVRSYACYMIHKYELDKKRYNIKDVESNDMERFVMLVNSENANQCCSDKVAFRKFYDLALNTELPFHSILNILCRDKEITIKTVRQNTYMYKQIYDSINCETVLERRS